MKIKAKITAGLISIFVALMSVFAFAWFGPNGVKASADPATTGTKVDIWYKTYKKADYDIIANFSTVYGFDYQVAKDETTIYDGIKNHPNDPTFFDPTIKYKDLDGSGSADADQWWNAAYSDSTMTEQANIDGYYYPSLGTGTNITVKSGRSTTQVNAAGYSYATVKAAVDAYDAVKETTTFVPTDEFVLLAYGQVNKLNTVELYFDQTFGGRLSTSYSLTPIQSDEWDSDKQFSSSGYTVDGKTAFKIGGAKATGVSTDNTALLGGFILKIDGSAPTGTYDIGYIATNDSHVDIYNGSGNTSYRAVSQSSSFSQTKQTITIKSATNIASASITLRDGTPTQAVFSGSESATNQTFSTTTYDLWKITDIYDGDSSTSLSGKMTITAKTGAAITKVSSVQTSIGAAIGALANSTSGSFNVSMAFGTTNYVAAVVGGSTYVFEFTRKAYTDTLLTSFGSLLSDGTSTTVDLYNAAGTAATTFNSGVYEYTLRFADDTANLTYVPGFDTANKGTTAKVGSTAITDGATTTQVIGTSDTSFTIRVYAQNSTSVYQDYKFKFKKLSTDTALSVTFPSSTTISASLGAGNTYSVTGLKYADNSFVYKFDNADHKANVYVSTSTFGPSYAVPSGATNVARSNKTFNITAGAGSYAAITSGTELLYVLVEAEAGNTEEYILTYDRTAASTDVAMDSIVATYTKAGATQNITFNISADGKTYTATANLDYTIGSYSVKATAHGGDVAKVSINSAAATAKTQTKSVNFSGTAVSTPACTIVITAEDTSTETYTVVVTRDAADDDAGITKVHIYGEDTSGNTIYGYDGSGNAITTSSGWVTSFEDYFHIYPDAAAPTNIQNKDATTTYSLPTSVAAILVQYKTDSSLTTLKVGTTNVNDVQYRIPLNFTTTASYTNKTMVALTQAGNPVNYNFYFYTDAVDTTSYIDEITATGVSDSSVTFTKSFVANRTDTTYSTTMAQTANSQFKLDIIKNSSTSKVYVGTSLSDFNGGPGASTFTATLFSNGAIFPIKAYNSSDRLYLYVYSEYYLTGASAASTYFTPYVVDVRYTDTRETDAGITDIKVYSIDNYGTDTLVFSSFNSATSPQTGFTVDYSIQYLRFDVTLSGSRATLTTGTNGTVPIHAVTGTTDVQKSYSFQATAENGSLGTTYSIPITRKAPKTGSALVDVKVNGNAADLTATKSYVFVLARGVLSPQLSFSVSSGATFSATSPDGSTYNTSPFTVYGLANGTYQTVTVSVTSEKVRIDGGAATTYNIYIINADTANQIDNIQILETDEYGGNLIDTSGNAYTYNSAVNTGITFNIAYADPNPYFLVTNTTTPYSEITGDKAQTIPQSKTAAQSRTVTISSLSEYGKILKTISGFSTLVPASETITYKFQVGRAKASSVNTLEDLTFTFNGGTYAGPTQTTYTGASAITALTASPLKFENLSSIPSVTIGYTKTDSKSVVSNVTDIDPMATDGKGTTLEQLGMTSATAISITLRCTAEDGSIKSWTFMFAYDTVVLDNIGSTKKITVDGNVSTGDILGFLATKPIYNIELSGVNSLARVIVTPDSSKAIITISLNTVTNSYNAGDIFNVPLTPGQTETVEVLVTSQDGANNSQYTINIKCKDLNTDSSLLSVTGSEFNGVAFSTPAAIDGFTPTGLSYTIKVTNDVTQYKLFPVLNDATATISSNNASDTNPLNLNVGRNTAQIVVTAEDTSKQTPYEFIIIRDDVNTLAALSITETSNNNNKITFGDPSTYNFNVGYSVNNMDMKFTLSGSRANIATTIKLNSVALAVTETQEDDGTGKMVDVTNGILALNEGKNILSIVVAAESGAKTSYTFEITRSAGSSSNYITEYVKEDGEIYVGKTTNVTIDSYSFVALSNSNAITYLLPKTYENQTFNPTITVSDGTMKVGDDDYEIVEANRVFVAGKNTFTVKLYAENNDVRTYNVVIYVADSFATGAELTDIITDVKLGNGSYFTYDGSSNYGANIPFSVNKEELSVKVKNSSTTVKFDNVTIPNNNGVNKGDVTLDQDKTITIVVESEYYQFVKTADQMRTVTIDITKEGPNTDTELKELTLTAGTEVFNLVYVDGGVITKISGNAKVTVSGNDFTISNLGEYIAAFSIKAVPNKAYPLTSLSGATYNSAKTEATTSITVGDTAWTHSHTITVYDEEGNNPNAYNIVLYRGEPKAAEDDNSITSIELYDSTGVYYINEAPTKAIYKLDTPEIKGISFGANKAYTLFVGFTTGSKAKVHIDGSIVATKTKQYQITYPTETSVPQSYTKPTEYKSDIRYYSFVQANGVNQVNYQSYFVLDNDLGKYISAALYGSYDATKQYYQPSQSSGVTQANYTNFYVADNDYVKVHTIQAESENGAKGTLYTIIVVAKAATVDATLSDIRVNGETISGFDPKIYAYDFTGSNQVLPNSTESLMMLALPSDPNATVRITNVATGDSTTNTSSAQTFTLKVGENAFSILVTAEDGTTTKTYTVKYKRDYEDPKLKNLVLEGEDLYDSSLKNKKNFDPDEHIYYSKVNYNTNGVNITATLEEDNASYTISPSSNVTAITKSGVTRTFAVFPSVGSNRYTFTVNSTVGKQTTYILYITRSEKVSSSTEIDSAGIGLVTGSGYPDLLDKVRDTDGTKYENINDLGNDLLAANSGTVTQFGTYLIPNSATSLPINVTLAAEVAGLSGAKCEPINNESLKVGRNTVILKITSDDKSQTQTLLIDVYRAPYEYEVDINEIPEFDNAEINPEGYTVEAEVDKLNFVVTDKNPATNKKLESKLISNDTLDFGENDVIFQVTSYITDEKGSKIVDNVETLTFKVTRENYNFAVMIDEIAEFKDDYANNAVSSIVPYVVDADATELTITAFVEKNNNATVLEHQTIVNNVITNLLNFGDNTVVLTVKSPDGKTSKEVTFKVKRPEYDLSVATTDKEMLTENIALTTTKDEKTVELLPSDDNGIKVEPSLQYLAEITVPSNITTIGAEILQVEGLEGGQVRVLTTGYLPAKPSTVEFEIVSPDGTVTKKYTVLVNRTGIQYDVVSPDSLYKLEKDANREGYYTLDLVDMPATIISDYAKAIEFNPNTDDLLVEVLSEVNASTNEVIIKITNKQNTSEVEYVHLTLNTTATNTGSMFDIIFWIVLGIAVVLLIVILICVNRDKYGSVSKNRKRA